MVFTPFEALGEVVIYRSTTADEMEEKTKDADVIVANKVPICESTIGKAQNLKLVCLTATGFNNLDGDYLKKRGIAAYNVAGYSTKMCIRDRRWISRMMLNLYMDVLQVEDIICILMQMVMWSLVYSSIIQTAISKILLFWTH